MSSKVGQPVTGCQATRCCMSEMDGCKKKKAGSLSCIPDTKTDESHLLKGQGGDWMPDVRGSRWLHVCQTSKEPLPPVCQTPREPVVVCHADPGAGGCTVCQTATEPTPVCQTPGEPMVVCQTLEPVVVCQTLKPVVVCQTLEPVVVCQTAREPVAVSRTWSRWLYVRHWSRWLYVRRRESRWL
jgi:hypothetical protein